MTIAMTPEDWHAAKAIAQELAVTKPKANELKKVVAYLCWLRNRREPVTLDRVLTYLVLLAQHGEQHGQNTPHYYQTIEQVCRTHLQPLQASGDTLIQILGWAARLHRA